MAKPRTDAEPVAGAHDVVIEPRLLDLNAAARYLGNISAWTVRRLVGDGHLKVVRLPSLRRPGELGRRLLFDRADLDRFIEKSKHDGL